MHRTCIWEARMPWTRHPCKRTLHSSNYSFIRVQGWTKSGRSTWGKTLFPALPILRLIKCGKVSKSWWASCTRHLMLGSITRTEGSSWSWNGPRLKDSTLSGSKRRQRWFNVERRCLEIVSYTTTRFIRLGYTYALTFCFHHRYSITTWTRQTWVKQSSCGHFSSIQFTWRME